MIRMISRDRESTENPAQGAGAVKGSHPPKRVKQCLLKEDSSDEEEEEVPRLKR